MKQAMRWSLLREVVGLLHLAVSSQSRIYPHATQRAGLWRLSHTCVHVKGPEVE